MAKLVETKLLKNERNQLNEFNAAWKKGEEFVKTLQKNDLTRNHGVAIYVYSDASVYKYFNNDTRHDKNQYKHLTFKWYSLHFLLTEFKQTNKQTKQML
ncbi:hypothetical protein PO909_001065 [Leuciscus waleckii]